MAAQEHTVSMKDLLTSGVHFGHQTRRWNPKMRPYIFGERGGIYIIDLQKSTVLIDEALRLPAAHGGARRQRAVRGHEEAVPGSHQGARRARRHALRGQPLAGRPAHQLRHPQQAHPRMHELKQLSEDGSLDLLPTREAMQLRADLRKLDQNLGGVGNMERLPARGVRRRPAQRGHRHQGSTQAQDPDRGAGGHELRPGRGRLHHPRQRRRHPQLLAHHPRGRGRRGRRPADAHRGPDEGRGRAQGRRGSRHRRGRGRG